MQPRHTVAHGEAMLDATLSGLGIAWLTNWPEATEMHQGRLEVMPLTATAQQVPIYAWWRE
ncbi:MULTISPECIES: LysR substrate-binding domain-containing protein [Pseudomonas]